MIVFIARDTLVDPLAGTERTKCKGFGIFIPPFIDLLYNMQINKLGLLYNMVNNGHMRLVHKRDIAIIIKSRRKEVFLLMEWIGIITLPSGEDGIHFA